jgi:hypothetical protein
MTWLQLRLDTNPGNVAALEDLMLATGAVAVTMEDNADQPVLEPAVGETPLWGQTRLTGLYPADADMEEVLQAFPAQLLQQTNQRVEILEDKDWEREWIQHYQPMQFGRRLWVCPSWLAPPDPDAVNLLLDPGLAFGTGTHPTTALCLRELDGMQLDHQTVVDYGCGSGILAVAALKLGASRVLGGHPGQRVAQRPPCRAPARGTARASGATSLEPAGRARYRQYPGRAPHRLVRHLAAVFEARRHAVTVGAAAEPGGCTVRPLCGSHHYTSGWRTGRLGMFARGAFYRLMALYKWSAALANGTMPGYRNRPERAPAK